MRNSNTWSRRRVPIHPAANAAACSYIPLFFRFRLIFLSSALPFSVPPVAGESHISGGCRRMRPAGRTNRPTAPRKMKTKSAPAHISESSPLPFPGINFKRMNLIGMWHLASNFRSTHLLQENHTTGDENSFVTLASSQLFILLNVRGWVILFAINGMW